MVLKRRRLIGSPMCLLNLAFRHFNVVRAMFWVEIVKHTAFDLDTGNLETAIATKNPVLQRPLLVSARSSGDRFSHRCYHTVPPGSWPWASPPHTSPSSLAHWLETFELLSLQLGCGRLPFAPSILGGPSSRWHSFALQATHGWCK